VPLSDAARALLKGLRQQAAPEPDPEPVVTEPDPLEPDPEPEPVEPKGRGGFRDRAKREEERFRLATDSEYWVAFCFRTPAAPAAFAAALALPVTGRYVSGPALASATAATKADKTARAAQMLTARSTRGTDVTAQLSAKPAPDPIGHLPGVTADLEADADAEMTALLAALTAPGDPEPVSLYDSPHWLLACWPHRDAKDAWLTASGLEVLGDKYLDGHQAARMLGLNPKEG